MTALSMAERFTMLLKKKKIPQDNLPLRQYWVMNRAGRLGQSKSQLVQHVPNVFYTMKLW